MMLTRFLRAAALHARRGAVLAFACAAACGKGEAKSAGGTNAADKGADKGGDAKGAAKGDAKGDAKGTGKGAGAPASAANVPDTALLTAEAARVAGFKTDTARLVPWRAVWAAPARLVLDPTTTQPLGSIVEGRVVRVLAQPGDRVRRDQVLVILHSDEMLDARNRLAQAQATKAQAASDLRYAQSATARAERLYAAKAGALADLERARNAQSDARASSARADAELSYANEYVAHLVGRGPIPAGVDEHEVLVRAPYDGVVTTRDAQPGSVVAVGAPLVTVGRLGTLGLMMRLPEQALGAARVGATVRFTVPAYPNRAFTARVVRVAPALDSASRTAEVLATVPNARGELKAEMTAAAELLGTAGASVLAVSDAAVQEFQGDTVVVTQRPGPGNAGGVVLQALPVRAGRRAQGLAEIVAGLAPGAAVVTEGAGIAKAEIQRRRDQRSGGGGGEGGG